MLGSRAEEEEEVRAAENKDFPCDVERLGSDICRCGFVFCCCVVASEKCRMLVSKQGQIRSLSELCWKRSEGLI